VYSSACRVFCLYQTTWTFSRGPPLPPVIQELATYKQVLAAAKQKIEGLKVRGDGWGFITSLGLHQTMRCTFAAEP
jgi:hypothetical protein